jgi:hypothetical protein
MASQIVDPKQAKLALLSLGAVATFWIYKKAPSLDPEDAKNFGISMLGLGSTVLAYQFVSRNFPKLGL